MKNVTIVRILGVSAVLLLSSSAAMAQTIHTYGDPAPAASSSNTAAATDNGAGNQAGVGEAARTDGGEEDTVMEYYQVSPYNVPPGTQQAARPSDALLQILSLDTKDLYRGVIPGTRDRTQHLERAHIAGQDTTSPNQLTWIGFVPEDTRTRVFLQSARTPEYEIARSDDGKKFTITFSNTRLPERNFSRQIDTSFFKRPVKRIVAGQQKGSVQVTIQLDKSQEPTIVRDGSYLFIDFPHSTAASTTVSSTR